MTYSDRRRRASLDEILGLDADRMLSMAQAVLSRQLRETGINPPAMDHPTPFKADRLTRRNTFRVATLWFNLTREKDILDV